MFIKICGLGSAEDLAAATSAGADAVGFVFSPSVRRITPDLALELCRDLPPTVVRVAVMLHPTEEEWAGVRDIFAPDWLQTDADDFRILSVPAGCEPLPVYRTGQCAPDQWPARLVFEGATSGSGKTADWTEAQAIAERTQLILAGGLSAANVADAIRRVRPWGVDVSSGVEREPGRKDPQMIREFIARVRATETPQ